jgi:hypothetical protein
MEGARFVSYLSLQGAYTSRRFILFAGGDRGLENEVNIVSHVLGRGGLDTPTY